MMLYVQISNYAQAKCEYCHKHFFKKIQMSCKIEVMQHGLEKVGEAALGFVGLWVKRDLVILYNGIIIDLKVG